jgi:hypothetical protein
MKKINTETKIKSAAMRRLIKAVTLTSDEPQDPAE